MNKKPEPRALRGLGFSSGFLATPPPAEGHKGPTPQAHLTSASSSASCDGPAPCPAKPLAGKHIPVARMHASLHPCLYLSCGRATSWREPPCSRRKYSLYLKDFKARKFIFSFSQRMGIETGKYALPKGAYYS